MPTTEVAVPDIGDFDDVPVIEVHVAAGDVVAVDDPLVTLESDKATMDVPSSAAGEVRELLVKVGDRVSRGSPLIAVEEAGTSAAVEPPTQTQPGRPEDEAPDDRDSDTSRGAHHDRVEEGHRRPFVCSRAGPIDRATVAAHATEYGSEQHEQRGGGQRPRRGVLDTIRDPAREPARPRRLTFLRRLHHTHLDPSGVDPARTTLDRPGLGRHRPTTRIRSAIRPDRTRPHRLAGPGTHRSRFRPPHRRPTAK